MKFFSKLKHTKALNGWRDLKIGWKYGLALLISIMVFASSMVFVFRSVQLIAQDMNIVEQAGNDTLQITEVISLLKEIDVQAYEYMTFKDINKKGSFSEHIKELEQILSELSFDEEKFPETKEIINSIHNNIKDTSEIFEKELVYAADRNLKTNLILARKKMTEYTQNNFQLLQQLQNILKIERTEALETVQGLLKKTIMILVVCLVISTIIGFLITFFVTRGIQKQMSSVIRLSDEIANGNLAVEKINYIGKDEIGQLARSVNTMADNLRNMIRKISAVSEEVRARSTNLSQSSNEVRIGSTQIAQTMEQLATGSEEQASSSTEVANVIEGLNERIVETNKENDMLTALANSFRDMASNGNELMEDSMMKMEQINGIVRNSVDKVKNLDMRSQEISQLVEVINNIAEQTNLLALNAAIEAARAGESGKGFAVVADEIRKLAEQVRTSIVNITDIVEGIQSESKTVADSLEAGYGQVEEGGKQIKATGDTFRAINQEVAKVVNGIDKVGYNLMQIAKNSEKINTSIENIASISEETAAGAEHTSESVQQQHGSVKTIAENAEEMSKLAEELQNMIASFKF